MTKKDKDSKDKKLSHARSPARIHQLTEIHEEQFWAQVERTEGGCWMWRGPIDAHGYGQFLLGKKRLPAHRISWVLDHDQSLSSFQQLRHIKQCKERACVRPRHLQRSNTSFEKWLVFHPKTKYYTIRPPVRGNTALPHKEAARRIQGTAEELQVLRHTLSQITSALPGFNRQVIQYQKNTLSYFTEIQSELQEMKVFVSKNHAILSALNQTISAVHDLSERVHALERTVRNRVALLDPEEQPASSQPEPRAELKSAKPMFALAEPEEPEEEVTGLPKLLATAFGEAMQEEPVKRREDLEQLEIVFDLAMGEHGDAIRAVETFQAYLVSFKQWTSEHPEVTRTPASFAREVSLGRISPGWMEGETLP